MNEVNIITLFPEVFENIFKQSIIGRARNKGLIKIRIIDLRKFASDKHKTVDDKPYGGGSGMILKVDVIAKALKILKPKPYSILMSVSAPKYSQKKANLLAKKKHLAIICGHYEGVDARVEKLVDETLSIGDFVLTGGEIAAMAIVDSITRLIPGVIKKDSLNEESFSQLPALLEYPQYTRPEEFNGLKVPKLLLSGNHKEIAQWRRKEAVKRTKKFRPDLIQSKSL